MSVVVLATMALRVWVIGHYAEPDGDAKGHLGIAAALLKDPLRIGVHWVWPPAYHYFLAGLLEFGVTAQGVRRLNCALAAVLPMLVWRYASRSAPASESLLERVAPLLAGALCAAMPVINLLGTSAQPGTLFAILVLLTVSWIDSGQFAAAGATLSAAVMVRYEAAGAIVLLAVLSLGSSCGPLRRRLPEGLLDAYSFPPVLVVPPIATIVAWLVAHRFSEGTFLGFLRELYRYTHAQRASYFHQDRWTDFLFFPVVQPYYLFGLTIPLFLLGIRRAWRPAFVVPLGIYLFLVGSYACKGVLASGRYYESLTPYLCIGAAHGVVVIGRRWRPGAPLAFAAAFGHVAKLLLLLVRWTFHVAW